MSVDFDEVRVFVINYCATSTNAQEALWNEGFLFAKKLHARIWVVVRELLL